MDKKIKNGILFICLNQSFGEKVAKAFADSISLHFANCRDLIEYDLFNSGEVLSQCGEEYYLMREKKVIKMACSYEDTIMFANYDIFSHNKEIFSKCSTLIYLKLSKKLLSDDDKINRLAFDIRDKELEKNTDITVNIKSLKEKNALKEIISVLGGIK